MRAMTVIPGRPDSAELTERPEPEPKAGELLVEPLYLGVCGTDREILDGDHGEPPPGEERLVLGHELLGRVKEPGGGFEAGQLVAGIVRRPDPVPCACCAKGEWDMCRNGQYTERGIKALDGYGAELVTIEEDFAIPIPDELGTLGVLTEPSSILAKAWEQIDRIATRACSVHERVLVTGAGPIGVLAALMGSQRGLEVHVLDRADRGHQAGGRSGARRGVPHGRHHRGRGVNRAGRRRGVHGRRRARRRPRCSTRRPGAIVCLTGVAPSRNLSVDIGALNNELVLENDVVFGSVNANRRHFEQAVESLRKADQDWLRRLITRTVPLEQLAQRRSRRATTTSRSWSSSLSR